MKLKTQSLLAAMSLAAATPAVAQVQIVDQSNPAGAVAQVGDVLFAKPIGQSFTPTLSTIDFAFFRFNGGSDSADLTVSLFAGNDDFAPADAIGTSQVSTYSPGVDGTVYFQFAAPLSLVPGQVYSLIVNDPTAGTFSSNDGLGIVVSSQSYAGGSEIYGGQVASGRDLIFSEGVLSSAAVPEPATWAMMILGMGAIGYTIRRRTVINKVLSAA